MEFHPIANVFPLMEGDDFEALVADVKANGVREAVIVHEGKILDGRNRYRACRRLGIKAPLAAFDPEHDGDPLAFVLSVNLHRRHLSESQRGMLAADLATLRHGANQYTAPGGIEDCDRPVIDDDEGTQPVAAQGPMRSGNVAAPLKQADAAKLVDVSERTVRAAAKVRNDGAPELVAAVKADAVPVSVAAKVAGLPEEQQLEFVASVKAGERPAAALKQARGLKADGPTPLARTKNTDRVKDAAGVTVPANLHDVFGDPWLKDLVADMRDRLGGLNVEGLKTQALKRADFYPYCHMPQFVTALKAAEDELEVAVASLEAGVPFAVCPDCAGAGKGCVHCRGCGYLPKWAYELRGKEDGRAS